MAGSWDDVSSFVSLSYLEEFANPWVRFVSNGFFIPNAHHLREVVVNSLSWLPVVCC